MASEAVDLSLLSTVELSELLLEALRAEGGEDALIEPSFGRTTIIDGRFSMTNVARYILDYLDRPRT